MSSNKIPMSASYKAIFLLSIAMLVLAIVGGVMSGSKTIGFAIWYWGYMAWKMYRRDNDSLVSLQKIMLWLQGFVFPISIGALLFSDAIAAQYVDVTLLGLLVIGSISMLIEYGLFVYFRKQVVQDVSGASRASVADRPGLVADQIHSNISPVSSQVEMEAWEAALNEYEGPQRDRGLYAKLYAEHNGDEARIKSAYIKIRAFNLQRSQSQFPNDFIKAGSRSAGSSVLRDEIKLFWSSFNAGGKLAIILVLLLIGYAVYESYERSSKKIVDGVSRKDAPLYRQLTEGGSMRWYRDTECFVEMALDFSNSVDPVVLSRASSISSNRYRELIQEDRLIAILFYGDGVSDGVFAENISKETFLKIKRLCESDF